MLWRETRTEKFYGKRREDCCRKRIENLIEREMERIRVICVFPVESELLLTFSSLQHRFSLCSLGNRMFVCVFKCSFGLNDLFRANVI